MTLGPRPHPMHHLPLERRVLGPILRDRAREEGDRPYMTASGRDWSFAETDRIARAIGRSLVRLGVARGDKVALLLPNGAEFVLAWYGCCVVGAAFVPVNTSYAGALLDYVLADSGSRGLVVAREFMPALATLEPATLARLDWIAVAGGLAGLDLPEGPARWLDFAEMCDGDGVDPEVACDARDLHSIMYTSGTTGPSKGVMLPNGHFFSSSCTFLRAVGLLRDDILFTPMPLFHGVASRLGVLPALMVGAQVVIEPRFSASRYFEQAARCNATVGHTIFSMQPMLKAQPPGPWDRAHRLRCLYNASYDAEFEARFAVRLVEAYGMTETGLTIYTPWPERREGSCGRVHEDWEMRLVDEQGLPVPPGEVGEILLRPRLPSIMMPGYINKPAETLRVFQDLWFHSGDYARVDADGFVAFSARKKERIRRRGENIAPFEIERVVNGHPAVADSAAVAHPAPEGEDDVRLVVEPKPGAALAPVPLMDWLQGRLPYFMLPRYVEIVATLPRTPNSKVEKYRLIAEGLGATTWDREAADYAIDRRQVAPR